MTKPFFAIEFDGDRNITIEMTAALKILIAVELHIKLTWPLLLGAQTSLSAALLSRFALIADRMSALPASGSQLSRANAAAGRRLSRREFDRDDQLHGASAELLLTRQQLKQH